MANRLESLEVQQVDLVGKAANRRKWLLLKAEESGLPVEILEELDKGESLDQEMRDVQSAFDAQFPRSDLVQPTMPEGYWVNETFDDHKVEYVPTTKDEGTQADAGSVVEEDAKGGDSVANDAELKKAQDELEALRKASADKDALLKAAVDAKADALAKAEAAEKLVKAERRLARGKELEPLCKSAQIDVEKMLDLEERDPETAKYLFDKVGALTKQVDELLKREDGSARHDERENTFEARVAAEVAKNKNLTWKQAGEIVAKADPDLYGEYVARGRK